jgi:hypothetical protein
MSIQKQEVKTYICDFCNKQIDAPIMSRVTFDVFDGTAGITIGGEPPMHMCKHCATLVHRLIDSFSRAYKADDTETRCDNEHLD